MSNEARGELKVQCRRWMPLVWRPADRNAPDAQAASRRQLNEKRLQVLVERETRERPSSEIMSLEALVVEILHCVKQSPPSQSALLAADHVQWIDTRSRSTIQPGDRGTVRMSLDVELPYEVDFAAEITDIEDDARGRSVTAHFTGRSQREVDLYEQLVFIYYRRALRDDRMASDSE